MSNYNNPKMPKRIKTANSLKVKEDSIGMELWSSTLEGVFKFIPAECKRTSYDWVVIDKNNDRRELRTLYLTKEEAVQNFYRQVIGVANYNAFNIEKMIDSYNELKGEVTEYFV